MTTLFIPAFFSCHAQPAKRGLAPASRAPGPTPTPGPRGSRRTPCLLRPSASATPRPSVPAGQAAPRRPPEGARKTSALLWFGFYYYFSNKEKTWALRRSPGAHAGRGPRLPCAASAGPARETGCWGLPPLPGPREGRGRPGRARGAVVCPGAACPRPRRHRAQERPRSREPGRPEVREGPGLEAGVRATSGRGGRAEGPGGAPCGAGAPRVGARS